MLVRMLRTVFGEGWLPELVGKTDVPPMIGKGVARLIRAAAFVAEKQVKRPARPGNEKDVDLFGGHSAEKRRRRHAEHGLNGDKILILAGCNEVDRYFLRGPPRRRDTETLRDEIVRRIHQVGMQFTPGGKPQLSLFSRQPVERHPPDVAREIAEYGCRQDILSRKRMLQVPGVSVDVELFSDGILDRGAIDVLLEVTIEWEIVKRKVRRIKTLGVPVFQAELVGNSHRELHPCIA